MRALFLPLLLATAACSVNPQGSPERGKPGTSAAQQDLAARISEIETASGGRLGLALHSPDKGLVYAYRGDERFAMCSTFKLALAALTLDTPGLREKRLHFGAGDILSYAPYAKERASSGWMSGLEAAHHAVTLSDNTAANLLLAEVGGPDGFTRWLRSMGDETTRLDRNEPALNENAPGDPRDTTTPTAHADLVGTLLWGDRLVQADRALLQEWLAQTTTGMNRLRAGLPGEWRAGDKTGTCGTGVQGEVNDIAMFETPDGARYILAAYLDRADGSASDAEARLAEAARAIADWLQQMGA